MFSKIYFNYFYSFEKKSDIYECREYEKITEVLGNLKNL